MGRTRAAASGRHQVTNHGQAEAASPAEVRAALAAAARLGMFFRLADPGLTTAPGAEADWQPTGLLHRSAAGPLDAMLDDAVARLRGCDEKIVPGWRSLAELALTNPRLRGSGTIQAGEPAYVRRSCCLYYRVDNGGMCGDCPLLTRLP